MNLKLTKINKMNQPNKELNYQRNVFAFAIIALFIISLITAVGEEIKVISPESFEDNTARINFQNDSLGNRPDFSL